MAAKEQEVVRNLTQLDREALEAYWMPFTSNRQFKDNPRLISGADGCHYITTDGRRVLDGLSGLWCCGAGHNRPEIADAVARQLRTLDYSPAFQFGHPLAFELANKIKSLTPAGLDYVFYTNSGSEAADTSLKIARAYWRQKGQPTKTRLIGRAKGYHGVNFGGISVGGIGCESKTLRRSRGGRPSAAHAAAGQRLHARDAGKRRGTRG